MLSNTPILETRKLKPGKGQGLSGSTRTGAQVSSASSASLWLEELPQQLRVSYPSLSPPAETPMGRGHGQGLYLTLCLPQPLSPAGNSQDTLFPLFSEDVVLSFLNSPFSPMGGGSEDKDTRTKRPGSNHLLCDLHK